MLRADGIGTCAASVVPEATQAAVALPRPSFRRVIDLTHTLSPISPTPWKEPLALEQISKLGKTLQRGL
jgi:hypothetical protein